MYIVFSIMVKDEFNLSFILILEIGNYDFGETHF